jgi:hypothetical protein
LEDWMTDWHNEVRTCACGMVFMPKREKQRHCSRRCRVADAVKRHEAITQTQPLLRCLRSRYRPHRVNLGA